jgi:hypothetical protein
MPSNSQIPVLGNLDALHQGRVTTFTSFPSTNTNGSVLILQFGCAGPGGDEDEGRPPDDPPDIAGICCLSGNCN